MASRRTRVKLSEYRQNGVLKGYRRFIGGQNFSLGKDRDLAEAKVKILLSAWQTLVKSGVPGWTDAALAEATRLCNEVGRENATSVNDARSKAVHVPELTIEQAAQQFIEELARRVKARTVQLSHAQSQEYRLANQIISTTVVDLLAASGVVLPADGETDEWVFSYGSNGNGLVYQARHRKEAGIYVRGNVADIDALKAVLRTITIAEEPKTKPATRPVQ